MCDNCPNDYNPTQDPSVCTPAIQPLCNMLPVDVLIVIDGSYRSSTSDADFANLARIAKEHVAWRLDLGAQAVQCAIGIVDEREFLRVRWQDTYSNAELGSELDVLVPNLNKGLALSGSMPKFTNYFIDWNGWRGGSTMVLYFGQNTAGDRTRRLALRMHNFFGDVGIPVHVFSFGMNAAEAAAMDYDQPDSFSSFTDPSIGPAISAVLASLCAEAPTMPGK